MSGDILVVDDEPRYRALYTQVLTARGFTVRAAACAEDAFAEIEHSVPAMVVSDVRMPGASGLTLLTQVRAKTPDLPFLLVTAYADVREAVAALRLGAVDYLAKPVDLDELVASVCDSLGVAHQTEHFEVPAALIEPMIAVSPAMQAVLSDAWRIADSDVNVLLTGESGVGKEMLARFLHRASDRADKPFIAVNCAALPADLLPSELFGHVRGAFTGASNARAGRFREADGGVIFLDEIGDMPLALQPVLLRVLEQRTITPVGGSGEVPVDFRLVAATNAELEAAVAAGRFRADLYYRLNVITLPIPPLRARRADIIPLARAFMTRVGAGHRRLSRATLRSLSDHAWPGNVRELENAIRRVALLARTDVILPEHLPRAIRRAVAVNPAPAPSAAAVRTLKQTERETVRNALAAVDGNRTKAAALLGITRRGLLKKLKRFELEDATSSQD